MDLFIYNWELLQSDPIVIRGHGLDENNEYKYIDIKDYEMFCYHESKQGIPMKTSDNIYDTKKFIKKSSSFVSDLRGHMGQLPIIPVFTATEDVDTCGWLNKTKEIHPYPYILAFDIEVCDGEIQMISCVGTRYKSMKAECCLLYLDRYSITIENVSCIPCKDELTLIDTFFALIKDKDPDIITGYYIYEYDFKMIIKKLQKSLHTTIPCSRPDDQHFILEEVNWESAAYGSNKYTRVKIPGRIIFDAYYFFKRFKLETYKLQEISMKYLNEGKIDIPYKEMFRRFKINEGVDEVGKYCIQDSILVLRLFEKFDMWNDLCEMSKIFRCDIEDLYSKGEQHKILAQMIRECIQRDIVLVKREEETNDYYQGATVLEPVIGIHDNVSILDFTSLYPSIMIAYNICPSTYCRRFSKEEIGLFPQCVQNLLQARKDVKKLMKEEKDEVKKLILNKRQNALKISANSMYGVMGFKNNKYFGCIPCASEITKKGRDCLVNTMDYISRNFECEVVYGDTDSCFVKFPISLSQEEVESKSKVICERVNQLLQKPMSLSFETYVKKLILLEKKRYVMVMDSGKTIHKGGVFTMRGNCMFAKNLYNNTIKMIANGCQYNEVYENIVHEVSMLTSGKIPLKELTMTKSVKELESYKTKTPQYVMGKRLKEEGHDIKAGDRLEYLYVRTESKTPGDKMYTPEEVLEKMLEIDYEFYIDKQLSTPLNQLLHLF
jgi:DNA polymerase delta subunit 1